MLASADAEQAGLDQMYCDLSVLDLHTWLNKCVTKDKHNMQCLKSFHLVLKLKASFAGFILSLSTKQVFVTGEGGGDGSNQNEQGLI